MAFENVLPPVREAMQALAHHPGLILASASSDNVAAYLRAHGADATQADMVAASPLSERSVAPKITAVAGAPTVVLIMGEIGWEVTAQGVLDTLNAAGGADLDIRINSPGGSAFEGFAIFNMLARYPGRKSVTVESVAASAASFIAMAGDDIIMAPASFLMIHNSMGMTMGDRQAHAATIAVLERIDATMAGIYAKRTGGTVEAMQALMNAETWFTADEAVTQGFADRVEEPVLQPDAAARTTPRAAALIKAFAHAPAAVLAMAAQPSPPDVTTVVEEPAPVVPPAAPPALPASAPAVPPAPATPPNPAPAVPDPKETVMPATLAELQAIAARAKLSSDWIVAQMVAKATPQAATEAAWEAVTAATVIRPGAILPSADQQANAASAIVAAIALRGGVKKPEIVAAAASMKGMSLRDMAADYQEMRTGQRSRLPPEALFRQVFASATVGMQTTGDFGQLLGQAIESIIIDNAQRISQEWRKIARTYSFDNFRPRDVHGAFDAPDLEEVLEHEEIRYGAIQRALGQLGLKSFAKGFAFSRQAIINNDLTQFTADGATYGAMAARSLSARVWRVFQLGTNSSYLMNDGLPFLHANHNNLAPVGTGITEAALTAAELALAGQSAVPGKPLGLGARYLVVGIQRKREAQKILSSSQIGTGGDQSTNTFQGDYELVYEPSFPPAAWALVADPDVHPVVAVSLLNGVETPFVDTEASFDTFGLKVRVGLDYEAAPIDFTGVYYNPGPSA